MEAGLTSALTHAPDAPVAVLETDEKYIPAMVKATRPRVVVLLNLSRDQMDRAAEIWLLARHWREALAAAPDCRVVANADDPLVAWAAGSARQVTWVAAGQRWREDSWCCPNCGAHLLRDGDDWTCKECGLRRPPVSWLLHDGEVIDPSGRATPLDLALPGRANRSNAVIALAVADAFGVHFAAALRELRSVTSVAGRYTQVTRRGCDIRLLLAKNPAGWLEALDVIAPPPAPVLLSVNAQGPDGRDTSWLWDVDFRRLRGRAVLVGGERRLDLAVRLEADEVAFRSWTTSTRRSTRPDGRAEPGGAGQLHRVPALPRCPREGAVTTNRGPVDPAGEPGAAAAPGLGLPGPAQHLRRPRQRAGAGAAGPAARAARSRSSR